jgi:hypothetical protein
MTTPTKIVVDCSTGEVSEIELTQEEIAQREADAIAAAEAKALEDADKAAKAADKAALLERLGITAEEAALLLG